jgi:hypothetical protein
LVAAHDDPQRDLMVVCVLHRVGQAARPTEPRKGHCAQIDDDSAASQVRHALRPIKFRESLVAAVLVGCVGGKSGASAACGRSAAAALMSGSVPEK